MHNWCHSHSPSCERMHKAYKCRADGWKNPPLETLESPAPAARACPPGTTPAFGVAGPPASLLQLLVPAHQRRVHTLEELEVIVVAAGAAAGGAATRVAIVARNRCQGGLGMGTVLLDRTAALAPRRSRQAKEAC